MRREARRTASVVIADGDARSRAAIVGALSGAGFDVSTAASGEEALEAARRQRPALVVLDASFSGRGASGYEVCHELRQEFGGELAILFTSADRTESYDRVAGLLIGADDYLTKPFAPGELVARARALVRRVRSVSSANGGLTSREHEVLQLLTEGLTKQEIGERLFISPRTVGTHIEHILGKLGVHSRAEAVARAYREGLLERA
jgi:two-component system nitrate/nitrite response regulator NarL